MKWDQIDRGVSFPRSHYITSSVLINGPVSSRCLAGPTPTQRSNTSQWTNLARAIDTRYVSPSQFAKFCFGQDLERKSGKGLLHSGKMKRGTILQWLSCVGFLNDLSFGLRIMEELPLIWSEEFDSGNLDESIWSYNLGAGGWGNSELQHYQKENVDISPGQYLRINVTVDNGTFKSGRVTTEGKFSFKYGSLKAKIQIPNVVEGLWPAFWTMGEKFPEIGWPHAGEVDVMEVGQGKALRDGVGNKRVISGAHWWNDDHTASYAGNFTAAQDLNETFHIYRLEWTPDSLTTYVDDNMIWTMDINLAQCPFCTSFHEPHHILLNVAVGGGFTSGWNSNSPGCGISTTGSEEGCEIRTFDDISAPIPATMKVDWIRLYQNGNSIITTEQPSSSPSRTPSAQPSNVPSGRPSRTPSQTPSLSAAPSDAPSSRPSKTPSNAPSSRPTRSPTLPVENAAAVATVATFNDPPSDNGEIVDNDPIQSVEDEIECMESYDEGKGKGKGKGKGGGKKDKSENRKRKYRRRGSSCGESSSGKGTSYILHDLFRIVTSLILVVVGKKHGKGGKGYGKGKGGKGNDDETPNPEPSQEAENVILIAQGTSGQTGDQISSFLSTTSATGSEGVRSSSGASTESGMGTPSSTDFTFASSITEKDGLVSNDMQSRGMHTGFSYTLGWATVLLLSSIWLVPWEFV